LYRYKLARLALDHAGEGERFCGEVDIRERLGNGAEKYQGLTPRSVGDVVVGLLGKNRILNV
jgi:hypothetical protein